MNANLYFLKSWVASIMLVYIGSYSLSISSFCVSTLRGIAHPTIIMYWNVFFMHISLIGLSLTHFAQRSGTMLRCWKLGMDMCMMPRFSARVNCSSSSVCWCVCPYLVMLHTNFAIFCEMCLLWLMVSMLHVQLYAAFILTVVSISNHKMWL